MSKFTPGPWKLEAHPEKAGWLLSAPQDQCLVADLYMHHATTGGPTDRSEIQANVSIIAAAPEMYEACKFVADKLNDPALVAILDAALAKAEGR